MTNVRRPVAAMALLCATPASAQQLSPNEIGSVHAEAIKFEPFAAFPTGAELATVVGDPTIPGPYVVRVKVAGGVKLMPHIHPENRVYTVISGVFYIGFGKVFDATKLTAYGPGSVVILPANTPHFHWAVSGEYVTQVTGSGPLGIEYVDGENDPRVVGAQAPGRELQRSKGHQ
jgi:quercetin dioxygenase-like cupin family protein